jgi:hypothetical protein
MNVSPEQMAAEGISPDSKVSKEGMALSGLSPRAFQKVVDGDLLPAHGAAIGEAMRGESSESQDRLVDWLRKQRTRYNANEIRDIAEQWKRFEGEMPAEDESLPEAQSTIPGMEDVAQKNYFGEKAQIQEDIRSRLRGDKKLFGLLSKAEPADKLQKTGTNVIDTEGNKAIAQSAGQILEVYQKLVNKAGPMEGIIIDAARKVANGASVSDAAEQAYPAIRAEIEGILKPGKQSAAGGQ